MLVEVIRPWRLMRVGHRFTPTAGEADMLILRGIVQMVEDVPKRGEKRRGAQTDGRTRKRDRAAQPG